MIARRLLLLASAVALVVAPAAQAQAPRQAAPAVREQGTLIYDGIPAIDPAIREPIRRYNNARSAGFGGWLPDGSMLISTRFGETAQVHRVLRPGGDRTQLTFFDEPVGAIITRPGSQEYAFTRDVGGAEYFQGFLAGMTGEGTAFTEPNTRNQSITFSHDGRTLAWARVTPGDGNYDIVTMTVGQPSTRRVVHEGEGAISPTDISRDGRYILAQRYISAASSRLYLIDARTGSARQLNATDGDVAYSGAQFSADGRSIIVASDEGVDQQRLVRIDVASGAQTVLTPGLRWGVEGFDISEDGRTLAYLTNEDGYSHLHLMDLRNGRAITGPQLPEGIISGLEFSHDGRRLGFSISNATSAGDVWSWDLASRRLDRWTTSEIGGLDPARLVSPRLVRFRSFDGLEVPAFVYRDERRSAQSPVIIDIHGGPEAQSRPGFNPRIQYWVNELGATVIVPNVRGSDGYGKRYLGLDNGPLRQNSVRDIGALLDWVATQPQLDRNRVVVYGGSYGGFMVLASLAAYSDRLAGAIDIVGISNFRTFLQNTEGYRRDLRRAEYGDERDPEMARIFEEISPLNLTRRMRRPLLVIQGYNDPRVPRTEAEQVVRAVRGQGQDVWFLMARDEGHGFRKKRNIDAQREVETAFLRRVFRLD